MKKKKVILIISGHDPTGGAGITADIETAGNFNFHALSILTCSTVQNTSNFLKINKMPDSYIYNCFKELVKEFKIDVIKIGLIPSIKSSREVLKILESKYVKNVPIIIDPIIKSGNGVELLSNNNINYIVKYIYPKAVLLTPNNYEYNIIKKIYNNYKKNNIKNILVTNYKIDKNSIILKLKSNNLETKKQFNIQNFSNTYHGTGCTFSTAIACNIGLNNSIEKSIKISLKFIKKTITSSSIKGRKQSLLNRNF
jgi:hydroxymethylpyrimidine/phosphomethylpyrimidine kinase